MYVWVMSGLGRGLARLDGAVGSLRGVGRMDEKTNGQAGVAAGGIESV